MSVADLAARLENDPDLVVLDASVREHRGEPQQLPGALTFDVDGALSDLTKPFIHAMPTPEAFTEQVRLLGVNQQSHVVVYDGHGMYSSARAWWMFRAMGFDAVSILDGGRPAWVASGRSLAPVQARAEQAGDFVAHPRSELFVDRQGVIAALNSPQTVVVDARSSDRFNGAVAEPRPGLRRGHLPGSVNLPFENLLDQGFVKNGSEIATELAAVAEPGSRLVLTCGSGTTACILALGALGAGYDDITVYDGSFSDWGQPDGPPLE
jgi:thiosulfate/3-mercaptopyruvate sulfurtransferase